MIARPTFGPIHLSGGAVTVIGESGAYVRWDANGICHWTSDGLCDEVPAHELTLPVRVSLPTRRMVWGQVVETLAELVPPGGTQTESTQIVVFVDHVKWGQRLSQVWRLGRPAEVPFAKPVARQMEFWIAEASVGGLAAAADEAAFSRFVSNAGRSKRRRDLRKAFQAAISDY